MRWLVLLLFLVGCGSQDEMTRFSGKQMTMGWEVKIADKLSRRECIDVEKTILKSFDRINKIYNNWNPDSEIAHINRLEAGETLEISEELAHFLQRVGELVLFTEGRFDPTIEPLQKLYKGSFAEGRWPDSHKLAELKGAIGWEKIHIDGTLFWKDHPKTALDLSGVAKGYGVDLLTEALLFLGYSGIYVEWGGEIRTAGLHKTGAPWRIAILGAEVVELQDEAIATSGNYYQKWKIEDQSYTHIIDPATHQPLVISEDAIHSVAVKGERCADVDALATALMIFRSPAEARAWIERHALTAWVIE